jgi:hypothetical protein
LQQFLLRTYTLASDRWLFFTRLLNTAMDKAGVLRVKPANKNNTVTHPLRKLTTIQT